MKTSLGQIYLRRGHHVTTRGQSRDPSIFFGPLNFLLIRTGTRIVPSGHADLRLRPPKSNQFALDSRRGVLEILPSHVAPLMRPEPARR